jgi:hypothetical protein
MTRKNTCVWSRLFFQIRHTILYLTPLLKPRQVFRLVGPQSIAYNIVATTVCAIYGSFEVCSCMVVFLAKLLSGVVLKEALAKEVRAMF